MWHASAPFLRIMRLFAANFFHLPSSFLEIGRLDVFLPPAPAPRRSFNGGGSAPLCVLCAFAFNSPIRHGCWNQKSKGFVKQMREPTGQLVKGQDGCADRQGAPDKEFHRAPIIFGHFTPKQGNRIRRKTKFNALPKIRPVTKEWFKKEKGHQQSQPPGGQGQLRVAANHVPERICFRKGKHRRVKMTGGPCSCHTCWQTIRTRQSKSCSNVVT